VVEVCTRNLLLFERDQTCVFACGFTPVKSVFPNINLKSLVLKHKCFPASRHIFLKKLPGEAVAVRFFTSLPQ